MEECKRLKASENVDLEAECYYRCVYGNKDYFYPHKHEFYEIFITVSGIVDHWINGEAHQLPEGSLVFIRPNDAHGYLYERSECADTEFINLTFTCEVADALFRYLSDDFPSAELLRAPMPPTVILNKNTKDRLVSQIRELNTIN